MDATAPVTISTVGVNSGKPYSGKFTIKTVLSRREAFMADERRRFIIGANANGAPPALQGEAYMLGLLFVRIVEAPDWWKNSDSGLDIEDENVIGELYKLSEEKIAEREKELAENAKAALNKLANTAPKKAQASKAE